MARALSALGGYRWWLLVLVAIMASEVFTAALSATLSMWWWGRVEPGLMVIGAIDAGVVSAVIATIVVIVARELRDREHEARIVKERLVGELEAALDTIHTLRGVLPICSQCRRIRDDEGAWKGLEAYVAEHTEAHFSHGLCPGCAEDLYPDVGPLLHDIE